MDGLQNCRAYIVLGSKSLILNVSLTIPIKVGPWYEYNVCKMTGVSFLSTYLFPRVILNFQTTVYVRTVGSAPGDNFGGFSRPACRASGGLYFMRSGRPLCRIFIQLYWPRPASGPPLFMLNPNLDLKQGILTAPYSETHKYQ